MQKKKKNEPESFNGFQGRIGGCIFSVPGTCLLVRVLVLLYTCRVKHSTVERTCRSLYLYLVLLVLLRVGQIVEFYCTVARGSLGSTWPLRRRKIAPLWARMRRYPGTCTSTTSTLYINTTGSMYNPTLVQNLYSSKLPVQLILDNRTGSSVLAVQYYRVPVRRAIQMFVTVRRPYDSPTNNNLHHQKTLYVTFQ
jgi:hypothetical protein